MHFPTTIRTTAILRNQYRPGFGEPCDMVVFTIAQLGMDDLGVTVWVDPGYPADRTEDIARSLLVDRLTDMTIAAAQDAMTATEVDHLGRTHDPAIEKRKLT